MRHLEHLISIVQSEGQRAMAVEDALEAFRQVTARANADHDGRLRILDKGCDRCSHEDARL